ncbi:hypothetical protein [Duganella phyllosphaerae]|uniref:hypothetical protein n=1 Tax=Duganella phyllosphaerae TaxID=762836 RepID=UPI0014289546|nr:hypothetical protein [Duganella phyllosphaerae]
MKKSQILTNAFNDLVERILRIDANVQRGRTNVLLAERPSYGGKSESLEGFQNASRWS